MSLKFLKKDALVKIEISSGFVQRLQQATFFLLEGVSKEKVEEYAKLVKENKELTEPWMDHVLTLSVLLRDIEIEADKQGLSYESDDLPSSTEEEN